MKKLLLLICVMSLFITGCNDIPVRDRSVDLDLTVFSAVMLAAEYDKILGNPNRYLGQTIKAKGSFLTFFFNDRDYNFIVLREIDACCVERFEIKWDGDFPPEGTMMEIVGVFSRYEDSGRAFHYLAVEEMSF
ncbi:MAG: hypothetical protein FWE68_01190 [Defluviitaleaceae bacterium]|nr:hypothetical protein [Defluviitaleaceae bacterium]